MEVKKEERFLPDSITLPDEYRKYHAAWMQVLATAQRAYDDLLADKDVGDCLPDLENINSQWISDFVEEKIEAVMKSPEPYSSRIAIVGQWRDFEKDINGKIKKIKSVYNLDPKANVELKGCHITITNMEELLQEKTKFIVPEKYKEYYNEIIHAIGAVEKLRAYEKSNKLPSIDINIMNHFVDPMNFIGWRRTNDEIASYRI